MQEGHSKQKMTVVVPVYNAPEAVLCLVRSLEKVYPEPSSDLSFLFADDHSPDPKVAELFESEAFFQRPDVRLEKRPKNLGFVGNVNGCLSAVREGDVVLLNSDTEIFSDVFHALQEDAQRLDGCGSVTALSNHATIASLFSFPEGRDTPRCLEAVTLGKVVAELGLQTPEVGAPTGVGFCMYLTREALNVIGQFDEIYGKGYGEENDWCQATQRKGFRHYISTKAFVRHEGSSSFGEKTRETAGEENMETLLSRYPLYLQDVGNYVAANPLAFFRAAILLEAIKRTEPSQTVLSVLHCDPESAVTGGTEFYVREKTRLLQDEGAFALEVFPLGEGGLRLVGFYKGEQVLQEDLSLSCLAEVFELVHPYLTGLHVHHLLGYPDEIYDVIHSLSDVTKVLSLHDFYQLCPSIFLMKQPQDVFCGVEEDQESCRNCLTNHHRYVDRTLDSYRERSLNFVKQFDALLFPSRSVVAPFEKAFASEWNEIKGRVVVSPHNVSHLVGMSPRESSAPQTNKIVFIGAAATHKGAKLLVRAFPELQKLGFSVELFGTTSHGVKIPKGITVRSYRGADQLKNLLAEVRPLITLHPSTASESFSFTFYEALSLSPTSVPVVSPIGHPADVVKETGCGVVMTGLQSQDLVAACVSARDDHDSLLKKKQASLKTLFAKPALSYVNLFATKKPNKTPLGSSDIERLRRVAVQKRIAANASLGLWSELKSRLKRIGPVVQVVRKVKAWAT